MCQVGEEECTGRAGVASLLFVKSWLWKDARGGYLGLAFLNYRLEVSILLLRRHPLRTIRPPPPTTFVELQWVCQVGEEECVGRTGASDAPNVLHLRERPSACLLEDFCHGESDWNMTQEEATQSMFAPTLSTVSLGDRQRQDNQASMTIENHFTFQELFEAAACSKRLRMNTVAELFH
ncbi:hypothetical protein EI94DRAFT_1705978 [Lactarius quietus]|nr:hypothetical protein EI94DRAFT_1705978 [Lactarius quietus]